MSTDSLHLIVMAKPPVPGQVKTRLVGDQLNETQAAAVHRAMLGCVVERLTNVASHCQTHDLQLVMCLAGEADRGLLGFDLPDGWTVEPQGGGDLGDRLLRIWQRVGEGGAIFFGSDSPDVPMDVLCSLPSALSRADAIVGPVDDGGYWTIGARQCEPALLSGIDWGTSSVYHQTRSKAAEADVSLIDLPAWHDVDEPSDLAAMQRRLMSTDEPELLSLREQLERITKR